MCEISKMAVNSCWLSVEARRGNTLLLPSTVILASSVDTFGSVLERTLSGESCEAQVQKVLIYNSDASQNHMVPLSAPIMQVISYI